MTEQIAILRLMRTKGLGPRTLSRLLRRLEERHMSVSEMVKRPIEELIEHWGLKLAIAEALAQSHADVDVVASRVDHEGITMVTLNSPSYPAQLRQTLAAAAPPVLFLKGTRSLLESRTVAIVGSRNASEPGLALAHKVSASLATRGVNIVSGFAAGIDSAAHMGALAAGGTTAMVLAEGILCTRRNGLLESVVSETNAVVVSEFWPTAGWTKYQAMQRNATVIGLSAAVVIIESGTDGGTFEAGKSALGLGMPVLVVDWESPAESAMGNAWFKAHGATMLSSLNIEESAQRIIAACYSVRRTSERTLYG